MTIVALLALPNGARGGASGDFNGDGEMDLAIGVPGERVNGFYDAGGVHVLYGDSRMGLIARNNQLWTRGTSGVEGDPKSSDRFGRTTAAGDFNGDGWDDLAIGVPTDRAGSVNVLYGSSAGLTATGDRLFSQDTDGVPGKAVDLAVGSYFCGECFGYALAVGDFNGDRFDDLAVGVPWEDSEKSILGNEENSGAVNVLYGSRSGLTAVGSDLWSQDSEGVKGDCEQQDNFGKALAAGDFNDDGRDDLAIGVPGETLEAGLFEYRYEDLDLVGAVNVLYGSSLGLTSNDQIFTLDVEGHDYDSFGEALAAGDFNGDGREDLAIGIPGHDARTLDSVGKVRVLLGSSSGLAYGGGDWLQSTWGIAGAAQAHDGFGSYLSAGDFDDDGRDDLAIGAPRDDEVGRDAGAVNVLYGSAVGFTAVDDQLWSQDTAGVGGVAEPGDQFGNVWTGDFNGDGRADLAIGVPLENVGSILNAGAVNVIYGSYVGLSVTVTVDQLWTQDAVGAVDSSEPGDNFGH